MQSVTYPNLTMSGRSNFLRLTGSSVWKFSLGLAIFIQLKYHKIFWPSIFSIYLLYSGMALALDFWPMAT